MGLFNRGHKDPNEEYQAVIKEEAEWQRKHPGQKVPLWLLMKRESAAKKMAKHIRR